MSTLSNNPGQSALGQWSQHQLLVLILTEMRLQTMILAQETGFRGDLDVHRVHHMNHNDIVTSDAG